MSSFRKLAYLPILSAFFVFATANAESINENEKIEIKKSINSSETVSDTLLEIYKFRNWLVNDEFDGLLLKFITERNESFKALFDLNTFKNNFVYKAHKIQSAIKKLEESGVLTPDAITGLRSEFTSMIDNVYSHIYSQSSWHIHIANEVIKEKIENGESDGPVFQKLVDKNRKFTELIISFMNSLNPLRR